MPTIAPYDFDEHVELAGFVDDQPVFALVDGTVRFPTAGETVVEAHDGLLSADITADGKSLVTGGEDGKVMRVTRQGAELIAEQERKWIDVVACGPNGAVGFGAGRTVWVATQDAIKQFDHERAVEGIAFAPKGMRIACARYQGVSLHWVAGQSAPVNLHWDGAHTGVTFSPDGRYIVTTMVENALHGWRLDNVKTAEGTHMRMAGYLAKPKSLSWSRKGRYLASSGAPSAVCWPFTGKQGPMGQAPRELGTRSDAMVTQVACHPIEDVVAIGFDDGTILAAKIDDAAEVQLRRSGKGAVSTLAWDQAGDRLVYGSEEGEAGVISVSE
ncbi:MAG: WD40 repeat domain-containing protein [Rhizobiaceae bacterium]|nr:WD40 repeat domain-containing protein [Hyphomicrobiales bacterium]NRB32317.1 WD40 repeat domain-containing protein [Rhizobiaceae bacterium]